MKKTLKSIQEKYGIISEQSVLRSTARGSNMSQYQEKPQLVRVATKKVEQQLKECNVHLDEWKIREDVDESLPAALKELRDINKHLNAAKLLLARLTKDFEFHG